MAKKKKVSFDDWYADLFGDRWPELKRSLLDDAVYAELREGLLKPYYLDEASLLVAESLEAEPGDAVLDMCAAPGGKTLVIALALRGKGMLVANDRSASRRNRLKRVLKEHLPENLLSKVQITSHDATRWGLYEQNTYDRILLDAPCSSERHVINSETHLLRWSPSRSRYLANQAFAMLSAAYTAARPNGLIVYSTCALSPLENDGVMRKLISRRKVTPVVPDLGFGDRTEFGVQVSPDRDGGRGPMYISRFLKPQC